MNFNFWAEKYLVRLLRLRTSDLVYLRGEKITSKLPLSTKQQRFFSVSDF
jgi:hypothetical protein